MLSKDNADVVLLDIEGTTSSIEFVYQTLFPYVRAKMPGFLNSHWDDSETQSACEIIAREAGAESLNAFAANLNRTDAIQKMLAEVFRLMDGDVKSTGLKALQGIVSQAGYASGELRAHFYPDVPPALQKWTRSGIRCCVYSSGSIGAQKNFYRYANAGDLSSFISANFDTTTGPKRDAASYGAIAQALATPPHRVVFLSDMVQELDAAKSAGMQTVLVVRPGNKPVTEGHGHRVVSSFEDILF